MGDNPGVLRARGRRSLSLETGRDHRDRVRSWSFRPGAVLDLDEHALARMVGLVTAVLLLTFGAALRLFLSPAWIALWPEASLAGMQLLVVAGANRVPGLRRRLRPIIESFCILAAGWLILLAASTGFQPQPAVGLVAAIPILGIAYGLLSRHLARTGLFFAAAVATTLIASVALPGSTPWILVGSLALACAVTLFVLVGWLDLHDVFLSDQDHYRTIVNQSADGIFLLDPQANRILDANPAFCRMTGRTVQELREIPLDEVLVPTSGRDRTVQETGMEGDVTERLLRNGVESVAPVEVRADRITRHGRDVLSVVVDDIRGREEYEERLLKAKESAEEIASFKTSMLTNMSHEIRTPLSSILGWAAVLMHEVPERQRELVRLIENSGQRLLNTLNSVIELAHLNANSMTLRPTLLNVNEAVETTAKGMSALAEEKGLVVEVDLTDDPVWVELDPRCLHRSLVHILDNAIKFTEQGTVCVRVGCDAEEAVIIVEDTGEGISEDFLPCIFDEFKQESAGLARDHEGNGLGLAISRRLVEMAGGRIDVESERGVGSTFTISMPAVDAAVAEIRHRDRPYARVS